ncbi:MAG: alkaline phosphatase [Muribaculaceae bacterium]|nr:alkaline phosphatase [Muribaculaceae bacterium]
MKLRTFIVSALVALSSCAISLNAKAPKYIFYFIGDGMGMGSVSVAQAYNRMALNNDMPLLMMQLPIASAAFTHSASSPVTDSAAAGTALATGHKTRNGMLGMTPDSVPVTSIATILKKEGFGIGLVTTVAPDDATPAAFYAHQPLRSMFYEIGKDAAASGFDFLAGANMRGAKGRDGKPTDLMNIIAESGVQIVRGIDGLKDIKTGRVLLLNTDTVTMNNVGYEIDGHENVLTLPAMTKACLEHLEANSPANFFMMVEGGTIDHAGHSNDAATQLQEVLAFEKSIAIAYDFYKAHPDETLIVITADHETGGLILANRSQPYNANPAMLGHVKMSKDAFSAYCSRIIKDNIKMTWPEMKNVLTEKFGFYTVLPVSKADDKKLQEYFAAMMNRENTESEKTLYGNAGQFTVLVYNVVDRAAGTSWTTNDHSGCVVPVFAIGDGASIFSNIQDNTEIPAKILKLAGKH